MWSEFYFLNKYLGKVRKKNYAVRSRQTQAVSQVFRLFQNGGTGDLV